MSSSRGDLVGEMRVRLPLPIVIPLAVILVIAGVTIGFSQVLLAVPKEAAVAIALITAMNVLGACAVIAVKRDLSPAHYAELAVVVLYPVIIGVAIAQFGLGVSEEAEAGHEAAAAPAAAGAGAISAEGVQFNTDALEFKAGEESHLHFTNEDSVQHNVAIYEDTAAADSQTDVLFDGEIISGGDDADYSIPALDKGEYVFQCDIHPAMRGTVTVE